MAEHVYDSSDSCTGKSAVQEPLEYSIYCLKNIKLQLQQRSPPRVG